MQTLTFARNIEEFQFVIVLVDYNQNSTLLGLENIRNLRFADQVKVFYTGFGMWKDNVKSLSK